MPEPTTLPETGQPRWVWPFELTEQIGEGGMGVVYRARYVVNNRQVAVKMLPRDVTDKTALARFEREMAVLKDLKHPNIVRCFGGACEDKRRFYAMELVEGGSLEDILQRRGRLSWEQVVEYGLQMCAALECSHRHGVVHRDVKPGNFLIAANGQIKLSDFGLASVSTQRRITHAGKTAGTFLYMAPEQIRGGDVGPQTDLYALGCVLFELLTGRPLFAADTPAATLHLHCKQPPPRVSEFALDCPATLEQLIGRLLEKEPANRPASAEEVARELRGVTQTITVVASRKKGAMTQAVGNRPVTVAKSSFAETTAASAEAESLGRPAAWPFVALAASLALLAYHFNASREWHGKTERAEQSWIDATASSNPQVRIAALNALGTLAVESDRALEALVASTADADPAIREVAVTSLGKAGHAAQGKVSHLVNLQRTDSESNVRSAAESAIARIQAAPETGSSGWPIWFVVIAAAGLATWAGLFRGRKRPGDKAPLSAIRS